MPVLLISLGTAPAIVPEAFLLPDAGFTEVHVLTTATPDTAFVEQWFQDRAPGVVLTVTRVAGFTDLRSEEDHFRFEEALYRWWLHKAAGASPHVCLAGGFKTMSSAMQKAAAVLGAAEVFHVLCDLPQAQQPKTADGIEDARANGHIHWIKLGAESGWPQFHGAMADHYPLTVESQDGLVRSVSVPDQRFRQRLTEVVERSHRIAGAWDRLDQLPFPVLATWATSDLAWLNEPVDCDTDQAWLASLPKIELHCHLGGFATHGGALGQVRAAAKDATLLPPLSEPVRPTGWPLPEHPVPLEHYMNLGDANGSNLLKDSGCLHRQCELLYQHLRQQNVIYAEIRCSPANYANPQVGRSPWAVLQQIKESFDRCMQKDPGCMVNLIIIATRREKGDYRAAISRHLALAVSAAEHWTSADECRVVAVDLAGYEDKETRAHYFRDEFTGIHRCGLALTVHAGENDDAEGIWRAVFDLSARRLGHALHLIDSPELMRSVADRGIVIEMCPFANYQIKGFQPMPDGTSGQPRPSYPLKTYLDAGIHVTVNTDNVGISAASLTDNLLLAAQMNPDLTRMDVLRLQQYALEGAFLPPGSKAALNRQLTARLQTR